MKKNKTQLMWVLAMIGLFGCLGQVFAAEFNKSTDLLMAQFDNNPDADDIQSQAAFGSMLAHPDLEGINCFGVMGAYGYQGAGSFIDSTSLFNQIFGTENVNWTDAHSDYSGSLTRAKAKVRATLDSGGTVWVQEAGQCKFTADWVEALLADGVSAATIKSRVIVVQHSNWNENTYSTEDLNYLKAKTTYQMIDDGNVDFGDYSSRPDRGPDTPKFVSSSTVWMDVATGGNTNTYTKTLWETADRIIELSGFDEGYSVIPGGGVDFSDCVENWWIFGYTTEVRNVEDFWLRYVLTGEMPGPEADTWIEAVSLSGESHPGNNSIIRTDSDALTYISSGSYAYYERANFGTGVSNFTVAAASDTAGGMMELRLDSSTGPLLGSVFIDGSKSSGWNDYVYFSTTIDSSVTGERDLYLVFKDGGYNVKSFIFSNDDYSDGGPKESGGDPARAYQESGGLLIMESENTDSPLGLWEKIVPGDANYVANATGTGHLEFTGNSPSSGPATSPLAYTFTIQNAGTYSLNIRARKRLDGESWDKCNDCYVRMLGDFTDGGGATEETLREDGKFFLLSSPALYAANDWGWAMTIDSGNHSFSSPIYNFKAGETYTLIISGRSQRFNMDRIILRRSDVSETTARDSSRSESLRLDAPATYTYVAIDDFPNMTGNAINYYKDTANNALAIDASVTANRTGYARASRTFDGTNGTYTIRITTLTEEDGESTYRLLVNNAVVATCENTYIGSGSALDMEPETFAWNDIELEQGDTLAVESNCDTNGEIPEGGGTAWSRGRWRQLELINASSGGLPPPPPVEVFPGNALLLDVNTSQTPVTIDNWIDAGVSEALTNATAGFLNGNSATVESLTGGLSWTRSGQTGNWSANTFAGNGMLNDYMYVNAGGVCSVSITGFEDGSGTTNSLIGTLADTSGTYFALKEKTNYKLYLFGAGDATGQNTRFTFNGKTKTTASAIVGTAEDANHHVSFEFSTGSDLTGFSLDFTYDNPLSYAAFNGLALVELPSVYVDTNYTAWADTFLPEVIGSETDDFDGDGVDNFCEYAMNGNPRSAADHGVDPVLISLPDGTLKYIHLCRNDDPNLVYTLQVKQDLMSSSGWIDIGQNVLVKGTNTVSGGSYNEVTNIIPTGGRQVFIRLKINR